MNALVRAGIAALLAVLALLAPSSAGALTLDPVGDFDQPVYVTSDPSDAGRLFVAEREGTIQLVENGSVTEFADLGGEVGCAGSCQGERGLMSIALSPGFETDGRLFAFYANDVDGTLHVGELVSTDPGHDEAAFAGSLFSIPHPGGDNHNGGQLQFGPEGDLYVSTGDGGGANDQFHNAQDPGSLLGKILRVDVDAPAPAVWSLGLRNPFRFSFDRLSGDMVIGDVGQGAREEIDFAPSPLPGLLAGGEGFNYGWNCREGFLPGPGTDPECATLPPSALVDPVFDYPQSPDPDLGGERCAVIGGYVVRDPGLGALYGNYVYSDLCSGAIRSLRLPAKRGELASGDCSLGLEADSPVSFGEDAAGRIYVVEQGGDVYRLRGPAARELSAAAAAAAAGRAGAAADLHRDQGAAAPGRTRQDRRADRLGLPLQGPQGRDRLAPAQRPPQRLQVPQPRLHRSLPAPGPPQHGLRRPHLRRRGVPRRRLAAAAGPDRAASPRPPAVAAQ